MNVEVKLTPEDIEAALKAYIRPKFPNHALSSFEITTVEPLSITVKLTESKRPAAPGFAHNYR